MSDKNPVLTTERTVLTVVDPNQNIGEFCMNAIKAMVEKGTTPTASFHCLYGGTMYYFDLDVRGINPPYQYRDPRNDENQWMGQRPS